MVKWWLVVFLNRTHDEIRRFTAGCTNKVQYPTQPKENVSCKFSDYSWMIVTNNIKEHGNLVFGKSEDT